MYRDVRLPLQRLEYPNWLDSFNLRLTYEILEYIFKSLFGKQIELNLRLLNYLVSLERAEQRLNGQNSEETAAELSYYGGAAVDERIFLLFVHNQFINLIMRQ